MLANAVANETGAILFNISHNILCNAYSEREIRVVLNSVFKVSGKVLQD